QAGGDTPALEGVGALGDDAHNLEGVGGVRVEALHERRHRIPSFAGPARGARRRRDRPRISSRGERVGRYSSVSPSNRGGNRDTGYSGAGAVSVAASGRLPPAAANALSSRSSTR